MSWFRRRASLEKILDLLQTLVGQNRVIMATLQDIQDDVTAEKDLISGVGTLISGLRQSVADALANGADPAKIDQIFQQAEANKQALATALASNTPTPVPTPAPVAAKNTRGASNSASV